MMSGWRETTSRLDEETIYILGFELKAQVGLWVVSFEKTLTVCKIRRKELFVKMTFITYEISHGLLALCVCVLLGCELKALCSLSRHSAT
jgi:hypothetical protein